MKYCFVRFSLSAILALQATTSIAATQSPMDLSGRWLVRLDPDREFAASSLVNAMPDQFQAVQLPGALRDSGIGELVGPETRWIGNVRRGLLERPEYKRFQDPAQYKMPFWLQPERHFVGLAHYRRTVEIPESWRDHRILLVLERPHWWTEVSVDGMVAGNNDSLSTPHVYDLTDALVPGTHELIVHVDNSLTPLDVGLDSHSVSDHTQSAWHGIVGKIELRAEPRFAVEDVQVLPASDARSAKVRMRLSGRSANTRDDSIMLRVLQLGQLLGERSLVLDSLVAGDDVECDIAFDREAARWDEFHPHLCQLEVIVRSGEDADATQRVSFGIRHIDTDGTRFVLNGRPLFLRGTLECCIFPLTGYPPTDVPSWKRVINVCKAHGLNHIRFHSWCPPEAAFVAADELGFYFQVECSTWPNGSTSLGNDRPVDEWLYREGERVLDAYGNHPSFLLLAMGNEPGGPERGAKYLRPWVNYFNARTDRQLVTAGSGWPSIEENQYHVTPQPRIQQWGEGVASRINGLPPATTADYDDFVAQYQVPVISHEIGQWCVFPNFAEMEKYTGSLKPKNFEIFRELLREQQMLEQANDLLMASGSLQTLCYKEEIESALRTKGFGGFQLLDLHDFPGQGTALVGVLDPFWDSKPYVTPEQFRRFCGPTVPLARLTKRSWTTDETFQAAIEVSHFGPSDLPGTMARWRILQGEREVESGELDRCDIPTGSLVALGQVTFPLAKIENAAELTLEVTLVGGDGSYVNDWRFWVFPATVEGPVPNDVLVVHELNEEAEAQLAQGKTVVLLADAEAVKSDVQIGFSPIFWNTAWTEGQAPHTLGILCDPAHPALESFPSRSHSDWQWWELITRSRPMVLDGLDPKLRAIVQVVPDWFRPQRLGLVFEAKVGRGKLLVCSIDLDRDLDQRPATRQFRQSLMRYAGSKSFTPSVAVELAEIRELFVD